MLISVTYGLRYNLAQTIIELAMGKLMFENVKIQFLNNIYFSLINQSFLELIFFV